MRIRHSGISIDVPEEWEDHSTLLFVGRGQSQSVSVNFVSGVSPESALAAQTEQLRTHTPGFELIIAQEPFQCGFGNGVLCEQRLSIRGKAVRQLAAAVVSRGVCMLMAASAPEQDFAAQRDRLLTVLRSLGPAGSS